MENDSLIKQALNNCMLDLIESYHSCTGLTGRHLFQTVMEATTTMPGEQFKLTRIRYYLSARIHDDVEQTGDLDYFWPLKYKVSLRPELYRIPHLRRVEPVLKVSTSTQTGLSIDNMDKSLLTIPNIDFELKWVVNNPNI